MTTHAAKTLTSILQRIKPDPERSARIEWERAEHLQQERLQLAARKFPFGERFMDARFNTYTTVDPQQKRAAKAVEATARAVAEKQFTLKRPWLILSGNPGTGKTHLLAAAYWLLAETAVVKGDRIYGLPRVFTAGELFDTIRADVYGSDRFNKTSPDSIRAAIRRRISGPLVIIDDFGVGMPPIGAQSPSQQEITFNLFNELYNANKPLLLATNLPIDRTRKGGLRLCDVLGARAWDRCTEAAEIVTCNWPSHRQGENLL